MSKAVTPANPNRVTIEGWLPAQEAAKHLGVSREYVYRLKAMYDDGGAGIPGFLLGEMSSVLMFRIADLDAYRASHPDLGKSRTVPANEEADTATAESTAA